MQEGGDVPFVVLVGFENLIGDDIKNVGGVRREGFVWSFPVKLCLRVPSLVLVALYCKLAGSFEKILGCKQ